ncbi:hypothetical protein P280DRAFT_215943 [Massarina eburnea CBS 473.64]|uniref:Uncharacterized protein n=1 Tax=Massarina eburnea CBS 473.64 TaxID=1395130 RepID=A0A6A6S828_9PLEO|nr:hypothetical protein P280DRAFT_215943 [Massarina eburnea CBS 473.64]
MRKERLCPPQRRFPGKPKASGASFTYSLKCFCITTTPPFVALLSPLSHLSVGTHVAFAGCSRTLVVDRRSLSVHSCHSLILGVLALIQLNSRISPPHYTATPSTAGPLHHVYCMRLPPPLQRRRRRSNPRC